jgi:hypothetical protein
MPLLLNVLLVLVTFYTHLQPETDNSSPDTLRGAAAWSSRSVAARWGGCAVSNPFGVLTRKWYVAVAVGAVVALTLGALTTVDAEAAAPTLLFVSQTGLNTGKCTSTKPCATVTYALTKAASGATIEVSGTIDDHIAISSPVTVTTWPGGPARSPAVLDGTASGTVVSVGVGVGVTLADLTIESGALGIYNDGTLTLSDSTVSGNATGAEPYAGVWNYYNGDITVVDSTIAGNSGNNVGAGIYNIGTATVIASTVSGNTGGGIYSGQDVTVSLGATIVAENTGDNCLAYDAGSLFSAGYNLTNDASGSACSFTAATDSVNENPLLGPLANNGGPTNTMLPGPTSQAADVIPTATTLRGVTVCPSTDQRGVARPGTGETRCTIGAAEVGSPTIARFTPTSGPDGTKVTIKGTNLGGATSVTFNGISATITNDTNTKLKVKVPSGAATGKITVTTPDGSATSATKFTVT